MFCVETSGLSFSHSLLRSPQKSERVGFSCLISVRTARIGRPPGFELVVSEPILHTPLIVQEWEGGGRRKLLGYGGFSFLSVLGECP